MSQGISATVWPASYTKDRIPEFIQASKKILATPTIYGTKPVLTPQGVLSEDALGFPTLDEDLLAKRIVERLKQRKRGERLAWRIGGAALGMMFGLRDGFQLGDLGGALISSVAGGLAADALEHLDERQRRELGLGWMDEPYSYIYHRKRHRGDAVRRIITVTETEDGLVRTFFAVQFPDGYRSCLQPLEGMSTTVFSTTTIGGYPDEHIKLKIPAVETLTTEGGQPLPIDILVDHRGAAAFSISYRAPHQFLY